MLFLINIKKKIIFGWSAKCGCTHVKELFYYLSENKENILDNMNNIIDISDYIMILIIRNPYKRIISGFLEKYGNEKYKIKDIHTSLLTFNKFVNILYTNPERIDKHHFIPQTMEDFDINKIINCKKLKIFEIENIDYSYIKNLFSSTKIINIGCGPHIHKPTQKKYNSKLYDICVKDLLKEKYDLEQFYNKDIYNKITEIYKDDLIFFKKYGFIYNIPYSVIVS